MRRSALTLLFILAIASLAPGAGLAQSPSPQAAAGTPDRLHELLGYLPPAARNVGFTDWSAIRHALGAEDVTGESTMDEKLAVLLTTNRSQAAASQYGLARLQQHREAWGWDTLDLDWEATISTDGPPLFVLRFRDGFDLPSVAARFDERGFSTQQLDGAILRSHEMDVTQDWLRASEFAVINTAFLDDGRTLVLSVSEDAVRSVVDALADPGAQSLSRLSVVDTLAGASAAFLEFGVETCTGYTPLPLPGPDPADTETATELLADAGPLGPYMTLGVGYGDGPDWPARGRIAFGYLDAASAAADLEGRRRVADEGDSLRVDAPYREAVFQVIDATAQELVLALDVDPVDDQPARLFRMVFARDMLFAACAD